MTGAIWQKTILNTVMALSTLPELHLIILYLLSFFLKSNSPEPFFQGGFHVSTYRSLFFFSSSNYKIKAISLHKVLLIHTLTKSYVVEKRNPESSLVELNKPILILEDGERSDVAAGELAVSTFGLPRLN